MSVNICQYCNKMCVIGRDRNCAASTSIFDNDKGVYVSYYYHMRCHAEFGDRGRYPQKVGDYVPYENPNDKLRWEREKEHLTEKLQIEFDFRKKLRDVEKDDRKEFMDVVMKKLEDIEVKLVNEVEKSRQEIASEMAQMIKQSEEKIIAGMEQKMEKNLGKLREQFVAVFASPSAEK